jgi:serine protease DegQ
VSRTCRGSGVGRGTHRRPGSADSRARALVLLACLAALAAGCTGNPDTTDSQGRQQGAAGAQAQGTPPLQAAASGLIPGIVQRLEPSVVAVRVGGGEGSGVVWSADGVIVTNNHVAGGNATVQIVFADGQRANARVLATDPRNDLAVVRAERRDLPAARFSRQLPRVGELAIAIGNPLGFEGSVTAGIVSGLGRSIPGSATAGEASLVDLLQTDAAISPGNSGGALVNGAGEVIGINVAYIPPQERAVSIGFAIPSPRVISVVEQLLEDGTVDYPSIGVLYRPVTPEIAQQFGLADAQGGVVVTELVPGGPAGREGIRPGDVIVGVEGRELESPEDLLGAIRARKPGDRIRLTVLRGGDRSDVTVTVGEQAQE